MADKYEKSRALSREMDKQRKRLTRQIKKAQAAGDMARVAELQEAKAATYQNRATKHYEVLGAKQTQAAYTERTKQTQAFVERRVAGAKMGAQAREKLARAELKGGRASSYIAATKQLWQGKVPISPNGKIDTAAIYQTIVEEFNKLHDTPEKIAELEAMGIKYPATSTADVLEWLREKTGVDYSEPEPDYKGGVRYETDPRSGMLAIAQLVG